MGCAMSGNKLEISCLNEQVMMAVNALQLYDTTIYFPNIKPQTPLTSADYLSYFEQVQRRLDRVKKPAYFYDELVLGCFDDGMALAGLNNYLDKKPPIYFKTLTLDLAGLAPETSDFITQLQQALRSLSRYRIQ